MASGVDAGDVLFLIARHLRACGLSATAMALLNESAIDTTWLCGSAPELRLLRDWVYDGDLERVRSLLEPLATGLSPPEQRAVVAIVNKQQLLESILVDASENDVRHCRSLLDELHAKRGELQLADCELGWCLEALRDRVSPSSNQRAEGKHWDVNEARMQCFERLVPFFRGDIGPEDYEHKYVSMPSTQLVCLLQDAVAFHRTRATGEDATTLDCVSIRSQAHSGQDAQQLRDGCAENVKEHLLFLGESRSTQPATELLVSKREKLLMSQSVDWSSIARAEWTGPTQLDHHLKCQTLSSVFPSSQAHSRRKTSLAMSLNFHQSPAVVPTESASSPSSNLLRELDRVGGEHSALDAPPASAWTAPLPLEFMVVGIQGSQLKVRTSAVARSFASDSQHSICIDDDDDDVDDNEGIRTQVSATGSPKSRYLNERHESSDNDVEVDSDEGDDSDPGGDVSAAVITSGIGSTENGPPELGQDSGDQPADAHDDTHDRLATATDEAVGDEQEEESEQRNRPTRYDQLTVDHIVQARVVAEAKEAHAVRTIAMNASGSQLVVGTNARALRVFDLDTPLAVAATRAVSSAHHAFLPLLPVLVERHKHHVTAIYCVAFNNVSLPPPRASTTREGTGVIASGDADSCIKVLSLATNKEQVLGDHPGKTRALHFAADHLLWSSCSGDRRICGWDLAHAPAKASVVLDGHVGEIQTLAFPAIAGGSLATTLLSAALDKTVRLYDTRSGMCERIVARTTHPAFALQFDPTDSRCFASGHQDGSVSVWDLRGSTRALDTLAHHHHECRALSWSPDGAWLLSGSFDGTICVVQVDRRSKLLAPLASYHQHQDKVLQAQWHPTQPAIVTTGADKLVKLWAFA